MILHHSHTPLRPIDRQIHEAPRVRIGVIGLGSIVALLALLNVATSLA